MVLILQFVLNFSRTINKRFLKLRVSEQSRICNGNRTEWSPVRSVIIRVINKIRRLRSGSPICLITSMITV